MNGRTGFDARYSQSCVAGASFALIGNPEAAEKAHSRRVRSNPGDPTRQDTVQNTGRLVDVSSFLSEVSNCCAASIRS